MRSNKNFIHNLIRLALEEDIGCGDITTEAVIAPAITIEAVIKAKEPGVLAGICIAKKVFKALDDKISFKILAEDGDRIKPGKIVARLKGNARSILAAERVALNFLCHLSGIATLAQLFVKEVKGTGVKILDTRKTLPGLRLLEKFAVRMGGAYNHRICLDEQLLIKDNHLKIAGQQEALERAYKKYHNRFIEIEVASLKEFKDALISPANVIMLDNMSVTEIKRAVALRDKFNKKLLLEVSGGVTLKNVKEFAKTGVDFISVGAITHGAKSVDFSLEVD